MRILGIRIHKVHTSIATRSVQFEFRCKSCGHTEPAIAQAAAKGTSVNRLGILDLFVDHNEAARLDAHTSALALAQQRALLLPCPQCHQIDEPMLARMQAKARKQAIVPTVVIGLLVGLTLGPLLAFTLHTVAEVELGGSAVVDALVLPIVLGCVGLTGWITWRVNTKKLMAEFDDELAEMQQDFVFRSGDPERYYEIIESEGLARA